MKENNNMQDRFLGWMYGHLIGRILLRPMVSPCFSHLGGKLLETRLSSMAVGPFVKFNEIDLTDCEKTRFSSYNDFFTRKLKPQARPLCSTSHTLISPCDGRLSVYPVTKEGRVSIKHTEYTAAELLKNRKLAEHYMGGTLWLYRLCVDDYHRYIYPVTGCKSRNIHIPGIYHTVNPVANDCYPIYKENTREYCLIRTRDAGTVLMMEVGAMLVGKIENRNYSSCQVERGEEKGNFAFGGSTIVVLTQPGCATPFDHLIENTKKQIETPVKLGEAVGAINNVPSGRILRPA